MIEGFFGRIFQKVDRSGACANTMTLWLRAPLAILVSFITLFIVAAVLEVNYIPVGSWPAGSAVAAGFLFIWVTRGRTRTDTINNEKQILTRKERLGDEYVVEGRSKTDDCASHDYQSDQNISNSERSFRGNALQPPKPGIDVQNMYAASDDILDTQEWQLLIEYDERVAKSFDELSNIELDYQRLFAQRVLEIGPEKRDLGKIVSDVKSEYEASIRAFDQDEVNDAWLKAKQISKSAADEFMKIIELAGEDIDLRNVLRKLEQKYGLGPSQKLADDNKDQKKQGYKGYQIVQLDSGMFTIADEDGISITKVNYNSASKCRAYIDRSISLQ